MKIGNFSISLAIKEFIQYLLGKKQEKVIFYGTLLVVVSSFSSNIFAYLFQLVLGRALSVSDYAILTSFFSLMVFVTIPLTIFNTAIVKIVSEIKNIDYPKTVSEFYFSIILFCFGLGVITFLCLIAFQNQILSYLNISDTRAYFNFTLMILFGFLTASALPFLQALQRFKAYSFFALLASILKFSGALLVLALNLKLFRVFQYITYQHLFLFSLSILILSKNVKRTHGKFLLSHIKKILNFTFLSSFSLLGLSFLLNNDILLVKHFFTAEISGFYSSATIIGKILFYAVSPISVVVFPIVAEKYSKNEDYISYIVWGTLAVFAFSSILSLGLILFPSKVISLLFSSAYLTAGTYLPLYSLFIVLYSSTYTLGNLLVAVSKVKITSLSLLFAFAHYFLIQFYFHNSVKEIILVSIFTTLALLCLFCIQIFRLGIKNSFIKA